MTLPESPIDIVQRLNKQVTKLFISALCYDEYEQNKWQKLNKQHTILLIMNNDVNIS